MAEPERLDTESMPLTERFTPTFDTGVHPKVEPELIEPEPPAPRRRLGASAGGRRRPPTCRQTVPLTDDVPAAEPISTT